MSDAPRLDGWKAIADHLGRDPRTAQRWHRERGMPVHHVPGIRGGTVFAYPSEIDAWLTAGACGSRAAQLDEVPPVVEATRRPADDVRHHLENCRSRRFVIVASGVVLVIASLAGVAFFNVGLPASRPVAQEWQLNGTVLSALDGARRVLWTFELPDSQADAKAGLHAGLHWPLPTAVNVGSETKLIATFNYGDSRGRVAKNAEVFCFGLEGNLWWRYRPNHSFTFAGREFAGPWRVYGTTLTGAPGTGVWISFIHRTWWPSFVVSLAADGSERLAFVNAGHVEILQSIENNGRPVILAGGFNNEFMLPAMAAFDARSTATVVSPQTSGTQYVCDNCPSGRPLTYLVFPLSDVNIALGDSHVAVTDIEKPDSLGMLEVSVRDAARTMRTVYRVSSDLVPESVAFSDTHWSVHRKLSASGKLDHSPEECPERRDGVVVRIWQPAGIWRVLRVGSTFVD